MDALIYKQLLKPDETTSVKHSRDRATFELGGNETHTHTHVLCGISSVDDTRYNGGVKSRIFA